MAQDDPADLHLVGEATAAMVGEAGIVVPTIQVQSRRLVSWMSSSRAFAGRRPAAVVEAVAEAEEAGRARLFDRSGKRRQRRVRIVRRRNCPRRANQLAFSSRSADQQRVLGRPEQRSVSGREERFACERKGNHEAAVTRRSSSCQVAYSNLRPTESGAAGQRR